MGVFEPGLSVPLSKGAFVYAPIFSWAKGGGFTPSSGRTRSSARFFVWEKQITDRDGTIDARAAMFRADARSAPTGLFAGGEKQRDRTSMIPPSGCARAGPHVTSRMRPFPLPPRTSPPHHRRGAPRGTPQASRGRWANLPRHGRGAEGLFFGKGEFLAEARRFLGIPSCSGRIPRSAPGLISGPSLGGERRNVSEGPIPEVIAGAHTAKRPFRAGQKLSGSLQSFQENFYLCRPFE